jgi:hypothetical protein
VSNPKQLSDDIAAQRTSNGAGNESKNVRTPVASSAQAAGEAKSALSEPHHKRPSDFEPKSRVLGMLAILVAERHGMTDKKFWHRFGLDWDYDVWKAFRRGERSLSDDEAALLADGIKRALTEAIRNDDDHILVRDLAYLRAGALEVLGEDYLTLTGRDDRTEFDRDFLQAYHIDPDTQDPRAFQECAHGFWFVIRRSTLHGASDQFRVMLLSINSNAYTRLTGPQKKPIRVTSAVPHFSLRTGKVSEESTDNEKVIRGQIVQTFTPRHVINFIGAMDVRHPPMFMMALKMNEAKPHATEAEGVLTTHIKSAIISGPVVACSVPLSAEIEDIRAKLTEKKRAASVDLSMAYRRQREGLTAYTDRYTEAELFDKIAPLCEPNSIRNKIRVLNKAYQDAMDGDHAGFYRINNG